MHAASGRRKRSLLDRRKGRTTASSSNLVTAYFVRVRIPYTCTQPGPVLAPLRPDLTRRTFRIWHRYGSCPCFTATVFRSIAAFTRRSVSSRIDCFDISRFLPLVPPQIYRNQPRFSAELSEKRRRVDSTCGRACVERSADRLGV